jgi:hypothetical protein
MHTAGGFVAATLLAFASGLIPSTGPTADQAPSRQDADVMSQKIMAMFAHSLSAAADATLHTSFSEAELNAYLVHYATEDLPVGVAQTQVSLLDDSRVRTRALVDLDAVRKSEPRGLLDPLRYVTGIVPVEAVGVLTARDGRATFTYESGTVGRLPLPRSVLHELVAFYTRTPDTPTGVNLDEPFALPAGIRQVLIRRGAATVVQ